MVIVDYEVRPALTKGEEFVENLAEYLRLFNTFFLKDGLLNMPEDLKGLYLYPISRTDNNLKRRIVDSKEDFSLFGAYKIDSYDIIAPHSDSLKDLFYQINLLPVVHTDNFSFSSSMITDAIQSVIGIKNLAPYVKYLSEKFPTSSTRIWDKEYWALTRRVMDIVYNLLSSLEVEDGNLKGTKLYVSHEVLNDTYVSDTINLGSKYIKIRRPNGACGEDMPVYTYLTIPLYRIGIFRPFLNIEKDVDTLKDYNFTSDRYEQADIPDKDNYSNWFEAVFKNFGIVEETVYKSDLLVYKWEHFWKEEVPEQFENVKINSIGTWYNKVENCVKECFPVSGEDSCWINYFGGYRHYHCMYGKRDRAVYARVVYDYSCKATDEETGCKYDCDIDNIAVGGLLYSKSEKRCYSGQFKLEPMHVDVMGCSISGFESFKERIVDKMLGFLKKIKENDLPIYLVPPPGYPDKLIFPEDITNYPDKWDVKGIRIRLPFGLEVYDDFTIGIKSYKGIRKGRIVFGPRIGNKTPKILGVIDGTILIYERPEQNGSHFGYLYPVFMWGNTSDRQKVFGIGMRLYPRYFDNAHLNWEHCNIFYNGLHYSGGCEAAIKVVGGIINDLWDGLNGAIKGVDSTVLFSGLRGVRIEKIKLGQ